MAIFTFVFFQSTWRSWKFNRPLIDLFLVGFFPIRAVSHSPAVLPTNSTSADTSKVAQSNPRKQLIKEKFISPGIAPAFIMGVEAVNEDPSILKGFKFKHIVLNGACEPDVVMAQFIKVITSFSRTKQLKITAGIVGPACSDTVVPLAGVSKHYHIPIISYGAEGAIFTDQNEYPYFFRTIPENKIFRFVYLELFRELGWKRIGSLTEDGQRYSEYITPLHELLEVCS